MTYIGPPPGVVFPYAGSFAPTGYLICDGSAVSRTTYADLFAAIGTAYGAGNGTTTFNLPDSQGRMAVGLGTHADVNALGKNEGIGTVGSRRPKHNTTVGPAGITGLTAGGGFGSGSSGNSVVGITGGPQTGAEPTDTPAYIVYNFIIKF